MTNATLVGLIVGGAMTVVGIIASGLNWRRLHRSGERPNIIFWLWFAACSLGLLSTVLTVLSTIYEYAGRSPWHSVSIGLLANGGAWAMLASFSESWFERPHLPSPPPEDPSLPSDTRSLPPG